MPSIGEILKGLAAIELHHFLVIAAVLFTAGLYTVVTRKNAVAILMGVELILNSANLNFIAFARYVGGGVEGYLFAIIVIILAASEAAVALAIVLGIYRNFRSVDVDQVDTMKG